MPIIKNIPALLRRTIGNDDDVPLKSGQLSMVVILVFILGLTGCNSSAGKPKTDDISGKYGPTTAAKELLGRMGYATNEPPVVTLNSDLSFEILHMPNMSGLYGKLVDKPIYDSGRGRWEISSAGGRWFCNLNLKFEQFSPGTPTKGKGGIAFNIVELRKAKHAFNLYFVVGDPDSGEGLEFTKIE